MATSHETQDEESVAGSELVLLSLGGIDNILELLSLLLEHFLAKFEITNAPLSFFLDLLSQIMELHRLRFHDIFYVGFILPYLEDELILCMVRSLGRRKWHTVCEHVPGRSANAVRNRYLRLVSVEGYEDFTRRA